MMLLQAFFEDNFSMFSGGNVMRGLVRGWCDPVSSQRGLGRVVLESARQEEGAHHHKVPWKKGRVLGDWHGTFNPNTSGSFGPINEVEGVLRPNNQGFSPNQCGSLLGRFCTEPLCASQPLG
jgi:hypothetical protein